VRAVGGTHSRAAPAADPDPDPDSSATAKAVAQCLRHARVSQRRTETTQQQPSPL